MVSICPEGRIIRNYPAHLCHPITKSDRIGLKMQRLDELRVLTDCGSCTNKCCSQPYDWVFLTQREITLISSTTGLEERDFVVQRMNGNANLTFRTLNLPCRFLDAHTGLCGIYEVRPLVCRLFPFYQEPLTGHATLLPVQCGANLHFVSTENPKGWCLQDFEATIQQWLADIWREAPLRG